MSQSSPEGIILGKGSKLVSTKLSIDKEIVLDIKQSESTYNEEDIKEYVTFCIECDRNQLPILEIKDWFKHIKMNKL